MRTCSMVMALFLLAAIPALAQNGSQRKVQFNLENNVAIQGYDPVAYFVQRKALKGKKEIAASYEGVTYYFSSAANRESFKGNPSAYEPQYGGWCAFAMGDYGKKVEVNPETFKVVNGKLYLFYNAFLNNTLISWNKNEAALKKQADANWKKIIHPGHAENSK